MKNAHLLMGLTLAVLTSAQAKPISHDLGVTNVDIGGPQRIVVLEYSFADALASAGVKPIGMAMEGEGLPYLKTALGDVTEVGTRAQPSLEKIAALKPDLIIADTSRHTDIYPQLQSIAPTLVYNSRYSDYDAVISQFKTITTLVGKAEQGQSIVREHRRRMNDVRTKNSNAGPILLGNSYNTEKFSVYNDKVFVAEFLGKLGFPSIVKGSEPKIEGMSLEAVVALSPERIVIMKNEGDDSIYSKWKTNPVWQSIPAAKTNDIYMFDRLLWAKGRGLMASELMLKQLEASDMLR